MTLARGERGIELVLPRGSSEPRQQCEDAVGFGAGKQHAGSVARRIGQGYGRRPPATVCQRAGTALWFARGFQAGQLQNTP